MPYDSLLQLGNHGSNLTEEELEMHTIAAWKEGKAYMNRQIDGHGKAFSRPLVHVSSCACLNFVSELLGFVHSASVLLPWCINSSVTRSKLLP